DAGKVDVVEKLAVEVVDANVGLRVFEVAENEGVVDDVGVFKFVGGLRDDRLPAGAFRVAGVDGDEAATWGLEVSFDPEDWAVVVEELVLRVEVVEQLDDLWVGVVEV